MNGYKKFNFDNFIIEDDEEIIPNMTESMPEEQTTLVPENITIPIIPQEPVEDPIKTYSEEEFLEAIKTAEQKGYDKGYQTHAEEQEAQMMGLMVSIDNHLGDALAQKEELQKQMEQDFMTFNHKVLQKLLPQLSSEYALEILGQFLEQNFPHFRSEAKLSFYFNSQTIGKIQEKLANLARIQDFEGKIALHKDDTIGVADCKIEWENGGVDFKADNLLEKVDNLLEENAPEN